MNANFGCPFTATISSIGIIFHVFFVVVGVQIDVFSLTSSFFSVYAGGQTKGR